MARFQEFYRETVVPKLVEQFGYKSVMEVPRIEKITLNMGVGEAVADKKVMDHAVSDMQKIAARSRSSPTSKKSIAGFKIRENYPGQVTDAAPCQMYEFLDRLVTVAMPRIRDWAFRQVFRWPWQLQHGCQGTDHFP
jgi:large subunit ribosomal protein L5